MIHDSPSLIYSYALLFPPTSSWLHKYYSSELSHEVSVVKGLSGWGKCLRIVPLQDSKALACHKDTVAVSSGRDITILDTITGGQMAAFSGHTDAVTSLTFLQDGASLVSGSYDTTVRLWDMQTGGVIRTFHGHTEVVTSVSVSANHITIASGSRDWTVRLWDTEIGECHCIIKHKGFVRQVDFFPSNPNHLMSVSGDKVWQWNIDGQQVAPTFDGSCITFSLDGTKFAFFNQGIVQVQNSDSGKILAELCTSNAKSCCFSPDGRLVAVAVGSTAYIWDITNPAPHIVETFISHKYDIKSLGFSSRTSLISTFGAGPLRFWQVSTPLTGSDIHDSLIQSITLQAKHGITISSDSDGIVRIWNLSTGLCSASFQTPAKGSCKRDIQLIDDRWTLVWHMAKKFHVWAIEKGELIQTVDILGDEVKELRISGDGSKVFYISSLFIRALDIQTGEDMGKVKLDSPWALNPFLAVDGSRVWMNTNQHHMGQSFWISDSLSIESCVVPINRCHLDFVGGIRQYKMSLPPIEDTITGNEFLRLPRSLDGPTDAQWDGQYLVAGYDTGDVLILRCNCTHSH